MCLKLCTYVTSNIYFNSFYFYDNFMAQCILFIKCLTSKLNITADCLIKYDDDV